MVYNYNIYNYIAPDGIQLYALQVIDTTMDTLLYNNIRL